VQLNPAPAGTTSVWVGLKLDVAPAAGVHMDNVVVFAR